MNPFKQIKAQGGGDVELLELLREKLHEEKLWLLRQPAIIPGLFRKRLRKLLQLVDDYNSLSDSSYRLNKNTDNKYDTSELEHANLSEFLTQYDAKLNEFRLEFMNAEEVNEMSQALNKMIALEEHYYDLVESEFPLEQLESEDVPPNEKLEAFKMMRLIQESDSLKEPLLMKELKRVKRILRVYRKS